MTNIYSSKASSTFSYVLLTAGLIAGLHSPLADAGTDTNSKKILQPSYSANGNEPTYDSMRGTVSGTYNSSVIKFEQSIGRFYEKLLSHQEPLGAEFGKVLYGNLWDLYES